MTQYPRTLKSNINHSNNCRPPTFFHPDINNVTRHTPVHSVEKTHVLVVTVELIGLLCLNMLSFNFAPPTRKSLRYTRFRKSYVNHPVVVLTNHYKRYTVLLLDVRCPKSPRSFFFQPSDSAVAFLSTPVVRMLLTPRWSAGEQM